MKKVDDIKVLCSELLYNSENHSQKLMKHMTLSAGLIENDITQEGCDDWFEKSITDTAGYIRGNVSLCSNRTLDDVHFLLLEMSGTVH
jgi:hypothetical protein